MWLFTCTNNPEIAILESHVSSLSSRHIFDSSNSGCSRRDTKAGIDPTLDKHTVKRVVYLSQSHGADKPHCRNCFDIQYALRPRAVNNVRELVRTILKILSLVFLGFVFLLFNLFYFLILRTSRGVNSENARCEYEQRSKRKEELFHEKSLPAVHGGRKLVSGNEIRFSFCFRLIDICRQSYSTGALKLSTDREEGSSSDKGRGTLN